MVILPVITLSFWLPAYSVHDAGPSFARHGGRDAINWTATVMATRLDQREPNRTSLKHSTSYTIAATPG
jgi:hypothetical protein